MLVGYYQTSLVLGVPREVESHCPTKTLKRAAAERPRVNLPYEKLHDQLAMPSCPAIATAVHNQFTVDQIKRRGRWSSNVWKIYVQGLSETPTDYTQRMTANATLLLPQRSADECGS